MPEISVIPCTSRPPHKSESITVQPVVNLPVRNDALFCQFKWTTSIPCLGCLVCSNAVEGAPSLSSAVFDTFNNR